MKRIEVFTAPTSEEAAIRQFFPSDPRQYIIVYKEPGRLMEVHFDDDTDVSPQLRIAALRSLAKYLEAAAFDEEHMLHSGDTE